MPATTAPSSLTIPNSYSVPKSSESPRISAQAWMLILFSDKIIIACQQVYGKTILLSIGGATYGQGGFQSAEEASSAAHAVWEMFGPVSPTGSGSRPFGSAVVDGFDFDFESAVSNMPTFGSELRRLMDQSTATSGKRFYLSAAPQCPFPDVYNQELLGAVEFDFVMIQFYNNYCGLDSFAPGSATQTSFNFDVWDNWARNSSRKSNTKAMIGIPAAPGAAARQWAPSDTRSSLSGPFRAGIWWTGRDCGLAMSETPSYKAAPSHIKPTVSIGL
ncbi:aminotransferase class III [Ilyonectria robusta]